MRGARVPCRRVSLQQFRWWDAFRVVSLIRFAILYHYKASFCRWEARRLMSSDILTHEPLPHFHHSRSISARKAHFKMSALAYIISQWDSRWQCLYLLIACHALICRPHSAYYYAGPATKHYSWPGICRLNDILPPSFAAYRYTYFLSSFLWFSLIRAIFIRISQQIDTLCVMPQPASRRASLSASNWLFLYDDRTSIWYFIFRALSLSLSVHYFRRLHLIFIGWLFRAYLRVAFPSSHRHISLILKYALFLFPPPQELPRSLPSACHWSCCVKAISTFTSYKRYFRLFKFHRHCIDIQLIISFHYALLIECRNITTLALSSEIIGLYYAGSIKELLIHMSTLFECHLYAFCSPHLKHGARLQQLTDAVGQSYDIFMMLFFFIGSSASRASGGRFAGAYQIRAKSKISRSNNIDIDFASNSTFRPIFIVRYRFVFDYQHDSLINTNTLPRPEYGLIFTSLFASSLFDGRWWFRAWS